MLTFSRSAALLGVLTLAASAALGGDAPRSGPQPGEATGAFDVRDITGPNKGKTLCYV